MKACRKRTLSLFLFSLISTSAFSQHFEDYFENRTLRIDYIFSGDATHQVIALDQLSVSPGWFGKRRRLGELPMEGNGQIYVRSRKTGEVIYKNSFSTLFQEWQSYPEAEKIWKSFENVFLIPMPTDTVDVTVSLLNNWREVTSTLTHEVVPTDILIRRIGERDITPFTVVQGAKDEACSINVAFIAEGYQESEMETFLKDTGIAIEAIFGHEPFRSFRDRFHIVAVQPVSKESGTSTPSKGIWRNTALHSHFDTFYSQRYLTTLHLKNLHDLLAGVPYEHIIVLVNTDEYGGGGILNFYNLAMTHHPKFRPVVVHEFGHSFAGLADEYAYETEDIPMYPHDVEPWEHNITTLVDFPAKWKSMLEPGTPVPTPPDYGKIGVYEGAGYSLQGVYRAFPDCRMRTNEHPEFCIVCQKAITRLIKFYTDP